MKTGHSAFVHSFVQSAHVCRCSQRFLPSRKNPKFSKMETKLCAVLLFVAFSAVTGYPANDKDEVDFVPLEHQGPGQRPGFDDFDYRKSYYPNLFDVSGLSDGFESLMSRMRQQLSDLLQQLSSRGDFPDIGDDLPRIPVPSDLGKGNSTSVTKVIDGRKVIINETDYKTEGPNGGAFFKIRTIAIESDEDTADIPVAEPSGGNKSTVQREVEPLEDSIENEIPKNKEGSIYDTVEDFDEIDYGFKPKEGELDWNDVEPLDTFEDNTVDVKKRQKYHDLSNDIYVNQLMADAGAPTNPDAEFIAGFERQPRVGDAEIKRRIR